jgi:hypothetical protein
LIVTVDLLKIWRSSADLAEAWFHLAPGDRWVRFDYPEAVRRPAKEAVEWCADDWMEADADERAHFQSTILARFQIRSPAAADAAQAEMKAWLLEALRNGALVGIGRRGDAGAGASPEIIPAFLFDDRHVDWEGSRLRVDGRAFTQIRVISKDEMAAVSETPAYRTLGRPSKKDKIMQAIDGLIAEGVDFNAIGRGEAEQKVRNFAKERLGEDLKRGFSQPVVRKAIVARCGKLYD